MPQCRFLSARPRAPRTQKLPSKDWDSRLRGNAPVRDYEQRIDVSEAMIHVAMGSLLLRRISH
jgi:hypothetical protein